MPFGACALKHALANTPLYWIAAHMSELCSRGLFWLRQADLVDPVIVPQGHVAGELRIRSDGHILLRLDGYFDHEGGPMSVLSNETEKDLGPEDLIEGRLIEENRQVILGKVMKVPGAFRSNGISVESYLAQYALVSCGWGSRRLPQRFDSLFLSLSDLNGWLRYKCFSEIDEHSISTKVPGNIVYDLRNGEKLLFEFGIDAQDGKVFGNRIELRQLCCIRIKKRETLGTSEWLREFHCLQDLFTLLTGSAYILPWPKLEASQHAEPSRFDFYFPRHKNEARPPDYHESPTNFIMLKDVFGCIFENWRIKLSHYGPSFYLFIGTMRGFPLYSENRFVNHVIGLEGFYNKKFADKSNQCKLRRKIERIVDSVQRSSDRRWLSTALKQMEAHVPLENKLLEIFAGLNLNFDHDGVRKFAKDCADRRNDIVHYGAQRDGTDYQGFVRDLDNKATILSAIYNVIILREIGVADKWTRFWFFKGHRSHWRLAKCVDEDLYPKEVLDPQYEWDPAGQTP